MSFFSSSTSYDHPFSYSVRRPSVLARMGTSVLETILPARRRSTSDSALHDQALTAQPPVLKRKRSVERSTFTAQEVVVSVVLVVATGIVTHFLAGALWNFLSSSSSSSTNKTLKKGNDDEE